MGPCFVSGLQCSIDLTTLPKSEQEWRSLSYPGVGSPLPETL